MRGNLEYYSHIGILKEIIERSVTHYTTIQSLLDRGIPYKTIYKFIENDVCVLEVPSVLKKDVYNWETFKSIPYKFGKIDGYIKFDSTLVHTFLKRESFTCNFLFKINSNSFNGINTLLFDDDLDNGTKIRLINEINNLKIYVDVWEIDKLYDL